MPMQAYRAAILRFADDRSAIYEEDGLLVVGPDATGRKVVRDVGPYAALAPNYPGVAIEHLPGAHHRAGLHRPAHPLSADRRDRLAGRRACCPGWRTTPFRTKRASADAAHARELATFFLDELLRHGVTTRAGLRHLAPGVGRCADGRGRQRGMRMIAGKVLQDRHSPDGVRDETEQSPDRHRVADPRWHGLDRLGYAITPRFAPSCSEAQLRGAGELAAKYPDVWIQSHVAENLDEIKWARELFPHARSYLAIYDDFGLMRERAIYAHCIHFDDDDRAPDARAPARRRP